MPYVSMDAHCTDTVRHCQTHEIQKELKYALISTVYSVHISYIHVKRKRVKKKTALTSPF